VGRERELQKLSDAYEQAVRGTGSAILLTGEAGIGKTRLTTEFAQLVALRGAQVVTLRCEQSDIERPLSLFVDLIPQLKEMPGALGCAPTTFSWLKRLTEFEAEPKQSDHSAAEFLAHSVRSAIFDLLDAVVEENPVVLIVEDAHWLDQASARMLMSLIGWSGARCLLVAINSRPVECPFFECSAPSSLTRLPVPPIDHDNSRRLLCFLWNRTIETLDPEVTDWCLRVAEGNPFFLQELAHHTRGYGWQNPPASVARILDDRISRLSHAALRVLQVASLLGDYATVDRVHRVLGYEAFAFLEAVEELSHAAMLVLPEKNPSSTALLRPRHELLSAASLAGLAPISLAFLHRRAADILEDEISEETSSSALLWACARHRQNAGDDARSTCCELGWQKKASWLLNALWNTVMLTPSG
jgi:predicted ATPase